MRSFALIPLALLLISPDKPALAAGENRDSLSAAIACYNALAWYERELVAGATHTSNLSHLDRSLGGSLFVLPRKQGARWNLVVVTASAMYEAVAPAIGKQEHSCFSMTIPGGKTVVFDGRGKGEQFRAFNATKNAETVCKGKFAPLTLHEINSPAVRKRFADHLLESAKTLERDRDTQLTTGPGLRQRTPKNKALGESLRIQCLSEPTAASTDEEYAEALSAINVLAARLDGAPISGALVPGNMSLPAGSAH